MKQCTKCSNTKPSTDFYIDKRTGDTRPVCKACTHIMKRENTAKRRAAIAAVGLQLRGMKTQPPSMEPEVGDFEVVVDDIITEEVEVPEFIFNEVADEKKIPLPMPSTPDRIYHPEFSGDMLKVMFIPDCHLPFHHQKSFDIMLRAGLVFKPDVVIVLGDLHDFYAVNAHGKQPNRNFSLKAEVAESAKFVKQIEQLGASKMVYLEGNHEYRFERYIENRAPDLFGMTSVPQILGLENRWVWVPYKKSYRLGKLHLTHDTGTAGRNAARTSMDAFQGSAVIGHTHRMELSYMGNADGPPAVGAMFGWLGDPVHAEYMHEVQARRNWVQGFGIGYMRPNGVVHLQPCPIVDGAVVIEGRLIT